MEQTVNLTALILDRAEKSINYDGLTAHNLSILMLAIDGCGESDSIEFRLFKNGSLVSTKIEEYKSMDDVLSAYDQQNNEPCMLHIAKNMWNQNEEYLEHQADAAINIAKDNPIND